MISLFPLLLGVGVLRGLLQGSALFQVFQGIGQCEAIVGELLQHVIDLFWGLTTGKELEKLGFPRDDSA